MSKRTVAEICQGAKEAQTAKQWASEVVQMSVW